MTKKEILNMKAGDAIEHLVKRYSYDENRANGDYFYINHISVSYIGGDNYFPWQTIIGFSGCDSYGIWCDKEKKIGDFKTLDNVVLAILDFIDEELRKEIQKDENTFLPPS